VRAVSTDPSSPHIPGELRYTEEHEWVSAVDDEGHVRVGITDYAQSALGDIVFVSLPEIGDELTAGSTCGELESTKSVSDVYAPLDGTVVARNDALDATPELVNSDAYGEGWLFTIRLAEPESRDTLLDDAGYRSVVGAS
jgi:glycine cleavage system H protein